MFHLSIECFTFQCLRDSVVTVSVTGPGQNVSRDRTESVTGQKVSRDRTSPGAPLHLPFPPSCHPIPFELRLRHCRVPLLRPPAFGYRLLARCASTSPSPSSHTLSSLSPLRSTPIQVKRQSSSLPVRTPLLRGAVTSSFI